MGTSFTKLRLFFSQSPISTHFFHLCMMLYTCHVKLFAEVSELFMHTVFQVIVIHKNSILRVRPSGG